MTTELLICFLAIVATERGVLLAWLRFKKRRERIYASTTTRSSPSRFYPWCAVHMHHRDEFASRQPPTTRVE